MLHRFTTNKHANTYFYFIHILCVYVYVYIYTYVCMYIMNGSAEQVKLNMSEQRLLGSSTDKFCIQNKLNISQMDEVYF